MEDTGARGTGRAPTGEPSAGPARNRGVLRALRGGGPKPPGLA